MKLRSKAILFFGTFLVASVVMVIFYAQYIVGDVFKKQTTDNFRIIAEQSENSYLTYLGSMKVRVLDWTSDNTIRELSKAILTSKEGTSERMLLAKEFATYVSVKKMPYDKTIFLTDLLDQNGIVIASTRPERIGRNEKNEEVAQKKAHNFEDAMNSKFGEVFFGRIVFKPEENSEPTMNATVRLFDLEAGKEASPINAVLLIYFNNTTQIAKALGSGTSIYAGLPEEQGRLTWNALLETYQTSNIYLVNSDNLMVTHSRVKNGQRPLPRVDTLPVRECFDNNKEVSAGYDNYQGVRVLGSSMCFKKDGVVIIVEVNKEEVYAPITTLIRSTVTFGTLATVIGVLVIILLVRRPLERIDDVVKVAKLVSNGKFEAQVDVKTKDELGYLATSFNSMITSIRDTQKELVESKNKVEEERARDEALLANLGEGMIATDKSGNIIVINYMAEKMLNLKSADVVGKKAIDTWDMLDENGNEIPHEQRANYFANTRLTTTSSVMRYRQKDGGYFPVAVTATPVVLGDNVIGSITIFRDITKEKELEKTRVDLLSLASHQLRTPLSGTKWLIETLKKGLHGPLSQGQSEYLDEIYKINERMTSLVHDMLGVLRMEGDLAQPKKEDVPVKVLLATIPETFRAETKSKHVAIQIPEVVDYAINTDPLLFQNILEILVSNAINYSEPGREVTMSTEKKPGEIIFAVKDSGIGIPKDEQRQIFERFYRATNAKTFDTRGSGLGLYIASMLAKKIGARLSFESELGNGSTFYVHVPVKPAPLPEDGARV